MGLFFKNYKSDIIQCARTYSSDYQNKYKNDSVEENAAAIKLFSHIQDFVNEVQDNEIRKAVKAARFGIDEVTLNMLHNLFLFYINEAVDMTGETFIATAVKAYIYVNDKKYEKHMIDRSQRDANDELLYSIVPASVVNAVKDTQDNYEDLSDVTKPLVDSAVRMGALFGYSKEEVLEKMNAPREPEPKEVREFTVEGFSKYENETCLNNSSVNELLSGKGDYSGKYHRFIISPEFITKNGYEYDLHGSYDSPPHDAFYEFNTFKEEDKFVSMDVIVNCGSNKLVFDEDDYLMVCGIVEKGLTDDVPVTFKALSISPADPIDRYPGEDGFSPNITVNKSGVVATLKHVDFYDETMRLYLSIKNTRSVKISCFPNISTKIIQSGKIYDYDNSESETDYLYPDWPEDLLPGEEFTGYVVLDGPNRTDSFSVKIPFYAENGKFPGRIEFACDRNNNTVSSSEEPFEIKESNDLAIEMIDKDYNEGLLSFPGMPLPILYDEAEYVTHRIFDYMKNYFGKEVDEGRMQKSRLPYRVYHTTMLWSALAGIGAMELWRLKGKRLLKLGVVYHLTKERDFFAMDEYVLDLVTEGFGSDEAKELKDRLETHIQPLLQNLLVDFPAKGIDHKTYNRQFFNYCTALYNYGLVIQDDRSTTEEKEQLSDTEMCGKAWLMIASQDHREDGLAAMRELDDDLFDEGSLALAMFTTDLEERKKLLEKAATMGNAEAMWQYSAYLPHTFAANSGSKQDETWLEYCVTAAENNNIEAMNELGNVFHRQKNYAESMYWYAMANSNGKENGQTSMEGIAKEWKLAGAPRDHVKGTSRFDEARFRCAVTYLEIYAGLTPAISVKELFELALSGIAIAGYLAGDIYESSGNLEMAFQAYKAIAFEFDPHGIKCYADMLFTGRGIEKDIKEAFEQYEEAAECGDIESMFIMGEYYRNEGKKNLAAYWYGKAYARGYEPAETRLIQMASAES